MIITVRMFCVKCDEVIHGHNFIYSSIPLTRDSRNYIFRKFFTPKY